MEVNHFQIPLLAPRDGKSDTWDRANDTDREMRVRRALLKTLLQLADIFGRNAAICLLLREFICFGMALLHKEERAPEREICSWLWITRGFCTEGPSPRHTIHDFIGDSYWEKVSMKRKGKTKT